MFGLGTWEILLILIAALVFIGPSKLPSLARTMGKGMRDVRRAMAGFEDEVRQASSLDEAPKPAPSPRAPEHGGERVARGDHRHANAPPSEHEDPGSEDNAHQAHDPEADTHHV